MPELPEVHTLLEQIKPKIVHKHIVDFQVTAKGLRLIKPHSQESFLEKIAGKQIIEVKRYGKFMIFILDSDLQIVGHLRMSGRLVYSAGPFDHEHKRLHIKFADNSFLNFIDVRRFGTFHLVENIDSYKGLQRLGNDALSPSLTSEELYWKFRLTTKNIYSALLSQSIIAGLGNIYVNESLFLSRIHPLAKARKLKILQVTGLLNNIRQLLKAAISFKGTTLIDKTYLDSTGENGNFAKELQVYGREGGLCYNCRKSKIRRIKISNRSVYYCPRCQKI